MIDSSAVLRSIKNRRVFLVTQLAEWLHCSLPTCRRRIKEWKALTSYNHNGRYYTLPAIPEFDVHGLWHYRDISFSMHGNLKKTVVSLVRSAPHGLSAADIGQLLRLNPQSFLAHFRNAPGLYREKVGGRFIWFAADVGVRKKQKQGRLQMEQKARTLTPSDREAVMILVDLLHHPGSDANKIVRRLKQKDIDLRAEIVHAFLGHHDLLKKTTDRDSSAV